MKWWLWQWAYTVEGWAKAPINDICHKCGRTARSWPKRTAEEVIAQAKEDPDGFGIAFLKIAEIESGERDQAFVPMSVRKNHICFLETSATVDVIDSAVFSAHQDKPASIFASSTKMETREWSFVNQDYEQHGDTVVAVEAGTVPPGVPKRTGHIGMRTEITLSEHKLEGHRQLRPEEAKGLFHIEREKLQANRPGWMAPEMVFNNVLSWDKWTARIKEREEVLKEQEAKKAEAMRALGGMSTPAETAAAEVADIAVGGFDAGDDMDIMESTATGELGGQQQPRYRGAAKATAQRRDGGAPRPSIGNASRVDSTSRSRTPPPAKPAASGASGSQPSGGIGTMVKPELLSTPIKQQLAEGAAAPGVAASVATTADVVASPADAAGKRRRLQKYGEPSIIHAQWKGKTGEDKRVSEAVALKGQIDRMMVERMRMSAHYSSSYLNSKHCVFFVSRLGSWTNGDLLC